MERKRSGSISVLFFKQLESLFGECFSGETKALKKLFAGGGDAEVIEAVNGAMITDKAIPGHGSSGFNGKAGADFRRNDL